jgi:hypothetical protein
MSSNRWWRGPGRGRTEPDGAAGAFGALGLAADPALTDDEVRMAWRRVAAATHPDRADGGDPAAFAAAAAAYSLLRTRSGRGEARGDVAEPASRPGRGGVRRRAGQAARLPVRIGAGRPWRLAARVAVAVAFSAAALAVAGGRPAGPALVTGAVTWLLLTAPRDLAP